MELYGSFMENGALYTCMEYMDAGSMDRYGPVDLGALECIAYAIIHGLSYLWEQKILHRGRHFASLSM